MSAVALDLSRPMTSLRSFIALNPDDWHPEARVQRALEGFWALRSQSPGVDDLWALRYHFHPDDRHRVFLGNNGHVHVQDTHYTGFFWWLFNLIDWIVRLVRERSFSNEPEKLHAMMQQALNSIGETTRFMRQRTQVFLEEQKIREWGKDDYPSVFVEMLGFTNSLDELKKASEGYWFGDSLSADNFCCQIECFKQQYLYPILRDVSALPHADDVSTNFILDTCPPSSGICPLFYDRFMHSDPEKMSVIFKKKLREIDFSSYFDADRAVRSIAKYPKCVKRLFELIPHPTPEMMQKAALYLCAFNQAIYAQEGIPPRNMLSLECALVEGEQAMFCNFKDPLARQILIDTAKEKGVMLSGERLRLREHPVVAVSAHTLVPPITLPVLSLSYGSLLATREISSKEEHPLAPSRNEVLSVTREVSTREEHPRAFSSDEISTEVLVKMYGESKASRQSIVPYLESRVRPLFEQASALRPGPERSYLREQLEAIRTKLHATREAVHDYIWRKKSQKRLETYEGILTDQIDQLVDPITLSVSSPSRESLSAPRELPSKISPPKHPLRDWISTEDIIEKYRESPQSIVHYLETIIGPLIEKASKPGSEKLLLRLKLKGINTNIHNASEAVYSKYRHKESQKALANYERILANRIEQLFK